MGLSSVVLYNDVFHIIVFTYWVHPDQRRADIVMHSLHLVPCAAPVDGTFTQQEPLDPMFLTI